MRETARNREQDRNLFSRVYVDILYREKSSFHICSSNGNMLDYDDVLKEVGEFGRWQICLFALLWIPSAVSAMQVR